MSKMTYTLPTSSPWVVTIDGDNFVVASTVARLLLQLAPKAEPARQTPKTPKTPKAKASKFKALLGQAKEKKSKKLPTAPRK